jgi:hypothetical protein
MMLMLSIRVNSFAQVDTVGFEHPPNGHYSPYRIDFNELISKPDYDDGQHLEVAGYLNLKFEVDNLWLSKAYFNIHDHKKAIPINRSQVKHTKRFNHRYVIIEALSHRRDRGLGQVTFELTVKHIRRWRGKGV